jgi:glycosyltransferase involved in cell wall biosynthesis
VILIAPHSQDEVVDGVRIKAVPKPSGRLARMTWIAWCVYREAMRQQADIYLFQDPELIPVGLLLRVWRKRVVYDIRELIELQFLTKDYLPRWARGLCGSIAARLQRFAVPYLSAVLVATPSILEQLRTTRQPEIVVVQNFPSPLELSAKDCPPWDRRPKWGVYIGRITLLRGIREMLRAIALLPDNLGVSLRIAGEFDSERLRDEVAQLPGWRRTEYLGWLDRAAVWRLLARGRFGLVTLHPSAAHFETWPVKLFEFMCAGIPVIASDFPLWREIVEGAGCGLVVDPLDPEAIAKAMEYLLTHHQEAEAMGHRGRQAVETRYNWTFEETKLLQLLGRLSQFQQVR